jgi:hypothetical protein
VAWTVIPTVVDGDDLTEDFTLAVKAAVEELQVGVPQSTTAWASPINAGITVGNGSTGASKYQVGDMMHCWFFFQFGSTSAITTSVDLDLPATATSASYIHGHGRLQDASTGDDFTVIAYGQSTTVARLEVINTSGTYAAPNNLSATVPFTWAVSDVISCYITFPTA